MAKRSSTAKRKGLSGSHFYHRLSAVAWTDRVAAHLDQLVKDEHAPCRLKLQRAIDIADRIGRASENISVTNIPDKIERMGVKRKLEKLIREANKVIGEVLHSCAR